jgi:hypothetical protein
VSIFSHGCSSIYQFYDIALSEYNQQKNIFWHNLLKVQKIATDMPVSKASIRNIVSFLHPAWTAGQVRADKPRQKVDETNLCCCSGGRFDERVASWFQ